MSDIIEKIQEAKAQNRLADVVELVPYAKHIGMQAMCIGDELLFILPALEHNIGNPTLPAIHGGCIGGFMENAALFHVLANTDVKRIPKIVDFSLDYLRPGRLRDTYATCEVVRQGRKVVNVMVKAWQSNKNEPIANARSHLLL